MEISETYSHLNGVEFMMVHKPILWKEITSVIKHVDAEYCKTKKSKEKTKKGETLYNPKDMNSSFKEKLTALQWKESRIEYWVTKDEKLIRRTFQMDAQDQKREIEKSGEIALKSYNQTDFIKERVAIEVQFGKYAFVAYDLFVKHLAFYARDQIDVGVEILPMKRLQSQMSTGVAYYEGELYNIIRQGRGIPSVPLIILGIDA